ncbi:hypothetical protein YC2023_060046 [Brassica napus]
MCSSHCDKRSSDVEMGEATSPAPIPTSPVEAPACVADHLSFRERLVRRQAEKEQVRAGAEFPSSSALAIAPGHGTEVVTPQGAGTLAGSGVPDASALPAGSSTTPILVEDKERAADSMHPPPARKEIVLALRAPSVVPVAQPKGRKRKFTKGGDGEFLGSKSVTTESMSESPHKNQISIKTSKAEKTNSRNGSPGKLDHDTSQLAWRARPGCRSTRRRARPRHEPVHPASTAVLPVDSPASSAVTRASSPSELGRDTGQLARRAQPCCRSVRR